MNGLDVFFTVVGLALLFNVVVYCDWRRQNSRRKLERLRKRGLA